MRIHRHKIYLRIDRPFSGPVESDKANPRAHGWATVEQVCPCGAWRLVNVNQKQKEVGYWQPES